MTRAEGRLRFGLTEAGKVILRGTIFIILAALIVPAFGVLSVLVAVMLVALAAGFLFRPRVVVTGNLPDRIIAGQTADLTYTIKNVGRLPAYDLNLRFHALPDAMEQAVDGQAVSRLGPGQTCEVAVAIRPKRRGRYGIEPPVCESSFPFNLFHFGRSREGQESLIVLSPFSLLRIHLPYVSRRVSASSVRLAGRMGTSPEYIGSRPFQLGDSRRKIDVRAWARLAVPATKEYDEDLDSYAALILDTRVPESRLRLKSKEFKELEAAVSLCASLAYTIHRDCLIDLLLAGSDLHTFTSLPRAIRLDRVHETLASVEPSGPYAADQIGPLIEERLGEISEVIFVLLSWDQTYQPLVELAQRSGCHCTVIVVGEQGPNDRGSGSPVEAAIRNPQSAIGAIGDVRFVQADEVLAGRSESL